MASLMALCEEFMLKDTFYEDAKRFLTAQNCEVLIIMGVKITSKTHSQDHIQRDLLIFSPIETQAQDIASNLKKRTELALKEKNTCRKDAVLFEQGDVSYSRKKIMPIIKTICQL